MSDPGELRAKGVSILLANRAKAAGDLAEARKHFELAAEMEETVFQGLAAKGRSDFLLNAISAVSCWMEAGDYQRALQAAGRALAMADGKDVDEGLVRELGMLAEHAAQKDVDDRFTGTRPERAPIVEEPIDLGTEHKDLVEEFRRKLAEVTPPLAS